MNKTTLKELGLYINYWTKQGLDAKACLKVEKANKNRKYKEPEVEFIPPTKEELRKAHLEKRKKQAQRVAKKARQEEELKERKSKIKTLLPLDDNPVEKPKKRGRPPKDKNKEQIRTKQKTLL